MSFILRDPATLKGACVDSRGRLETHSTVRTQTEAQSVLGQAFVINTAAIALGANTAMMYVKNNSLMVLHADFLALGVGVPSVAFDGELTLEVVRSPTTGSIITNAVPVTIKTNQNFGSSNEFTDILAYKGVSGDTFTDGTVMSFFYQVGSGRLSAGLSWVMPPGSSVGFRLLPNMSSGTVNTYVAIVGYLDEPGG